MKYLAFFSLLLFSFPAFAESNPTGYFGALWDFINWIYDSIGDFKNDLLGYFMEVVKYFTFVWLNLKIATVTFVWGLVEPLIDALNLTDLITANFGGLSPDVQALITELRIGEAVNLLVSAKVSKMILNMMGW